MNKKGFTLVELLAVIALITVLSLIVTVSLRGISRNSEIKLMQTNFDLIISSANTLGEDYLSELITTRSVYVQQLKSYSSLSLDSSYDTLLVYIYQKNNRAYSCIDQTVNADTFSNLGIKEGEYSKFNKYKCPILEGNNGSTNPPTETTQSCTDIYSVVHTEDECNGQPWDSCKLILCNSIPVPEPIIPNPNICIDSEAHIHTSSECNGEAWSTCKERLCPTPEPVVEPVKCVKNGNNYALLDTGTNVRNQIISVVGGESFLKNIKDIVYCNSNNITCKSLLSSAKTVSVSNSPVAVKVAYSYGDKKLYFISDVGNNCVYLNADSSKMFKGFSGLNNLSVIGKFDTSQVIYMNEMFNMNLYSGSSALTSLKDLENWDTSKVTTMQGMFKTCNGLTSLEGLEKWNVSNVTDMNEMFSMEYLEKKNTVQNLKPLANWKTSKVTTMRKMFMHFDNLTSLEGLEKWNVEKVGNINAMFAYEINVKDLVPLIDWKLYNVTQMNEIFMSMEKVPDLEPLRNWEDLGKNSSAVYIGAAFLGMKDITSIEPISDWKYTSKFNVFNSYNTSSSLFNGLFQGTSLTLEGLKPIKKWTFKVIQRTDSPKYPSYCTDHKSNQFRNIFNGLNTGYFASLDLNILGNDGKPLVKNVDYFINTTEYNSGTSTWAVGSIILKNEGYNETHCGIKNH